jgi:hypothetical protein
MDIQPEKLLADFMQVAALAHLPIAASDIHYEVLSAPHKRPSRLPTGKKVVYVFCSENHCLKVGRASGKSQARFTSQHYLPNSCNSNLAKSLLADIARVGATSLFFTAESCASITAANIAQWIEQHTTRYHFFVDETHDAPILALLEIFLQCRLCPLFESGY